MLFRFDKPRIHQDAFIKDVYDAVSNGKHLIAHAPTGLGKTSAALAPAIKYAIDNGKTVFFLTPKNSQHNIAVQDLLGMQKKHNTKIRVTDLVGKKHMCTDPILGNSDFAGFYEICKRKVDKESCLYYSNSTGFTKKQRMKAKLQMEGFVNELPLVTSHEHMNELATNAKHAGQARPLCSYDAAIQACKESQVIIADYFHLLSPEISEKFLAKIGKKLEDAIVIVDEAQNLPSRIRSLETNSISTFILERATEELKKQGEDAWAVVLNNLKEVITKLGNRKILEYKREALIGKYEILDTIGRDVQNLEQFIEELYEQGRDYLELHNKNKSYLHSVAKFLEAWNKEDNPSYVRLIRKKQDGNYTVIYSALDPSNTTAELFKQIHSAILMSGTLTPTAMYRDLLGLEEGRTILKEYQSPFKQENRLNLIVPTITTKYSKREPETYEKIAKEIIKLSNQMPGNIAVFYPSYRVMKQVTPMLQAIRRPLFEQRDDMSPTQLKKLVDKFKAQGKAFGGILNAVNGGSLSEGIDYPGDELQNVVIVGIPLAEMNLEVKALIDYYDKKYKKGWHYGYMYPAMCKAIQAAGRCIRNETDKGVVVYLDERYTWNNYKICFPKDVQTKETLEPEALIKAFW